MGFSQTSIKPTNLNFIRKHIISLAAIVGSILLAICIMVDTVQSSSPSVHKAKRIIEHNLHERETYAQKIIQAPALVKAAGNYKATAAYFKSANKRSDIFYYVYKEDVLNYWSSNEFIPNNVDKISASDIVFFKEGNGFYEVLHYSNEKSGITILALIPVYYQYTTSNKFLVNGFVWKQPFLKRFVISNKEAKNTTSILNNKGAYLFSIRIIDNVNSIYNPYTVILEILGWLLLLLAVHHILKSMMMKQQYAMTFVIFAAVVIIIELLFNQFNVFALTKSSLLFSSNLFASSHLANNLGTLLIRVGLMAWFFSLLRFVRRESLSDTYKNAWSIVVVILYFLIVLIIQSVIQNSVISFNFYLVNTLDRYTIISLIVFGLAISSLLFLMKWLFEQGYSLQKNFLAIAILITLIGAVFIYVNKGITDIWYLCFLILWLATFILFFYYEKTVFPQNQKYKFLSNIILLSLISFLVSIIIIFNTAQKDIEKRKYRMEELVSEQDIGEEYTLIESESDILNDNFIKSYFKNPYISTVDIENRISAKYYKPLLRRYIISTYTFDENGLPLIGLPLKSYYKLLNTKNSRKAKPISTHYNYLSIKENGEKYLGYFPIQEDTSILGYLFVEFVPKIFSSYSAYPELLMKQKNYYDEEFDNFSYAIYDNKYLLKQRGDYEYQVNFNIPVDSTLEFNMYKTNDYTHLIYFSNDKQVVLSEKNRPTLSTLSVFSYMLIFFLLFFIFIDLIGFSNKFWGEDSLRDFLKGNTLQKQIQNSMIALVLFSLAIIGLVTMVYFQYQYNIYHNGKLLKKVNAVMKNVAQYYIDEFPVYGNNTFDKVIQQKLKVISNIHALDINVYNTKGDLIVSSQSEIFKRNLVSTKMDAAAYYNLITLGKSKYVHDENIGKLTYLSAYQPFRSNGKVLGYFNFPYYGKQKSFQEDISYFLVALVNVYVIFLIAAALLAVFLSRSITNSLTLISENIKGVQFGKNNQQIKWKNDDEIGLLVKQYNLMLDELEKSADLLAKSEREGAWREMAKQVAHEIKNPLTPMKLSIQHLQRALKDNSPDIKELTEKISQRMIEQIDNLSNIATAFSDFAKMPQGTFQKIDIYPILFSTVDLFRETENIEINVNAFKEEMFINGDKEQLMRVFTNILKNAAQAIPENKLGIIDIALEETDNEYIISIKDNGVGIAEEKRDKIFEPNFTTKNSGTGLGLAICKNIIERMNGNIWFDSVVDEYTIFYIQLPKMK